MSWRTASRRDSPAILRLILSDEKLCVPLAARYKEAGRGSMVFINTSPAGNVSDCFFFSAHGLLLPLFKSPRLEGEALSRLLLGLRPAVHSIMGVAAWVARVESLLPLSPTTRVEYHLMAVEKTAYVPPRRQVPAACIRQASVADAEALFSLQKSYEMEEVVLNPALFNDAQCARLLKKSLREEVIFIAEMEGVPVAKAGTNARGYGVDQIGGVFTAPSRRGRGLAVVVMARLLESIFTEKHGACLFVKKTNAAAIALYKRLGFRIVTEYVIDYFG